jgi:hypothetical protein
MSNNTQRYEVVAPMPHFTHLFKGDILVPKQHALAGDCWGHEDETNPLRWVTFCPKFPHLFRLLKWWEHVPIDELPKYVKWVDGSCAEYFKVDKWLLEKPTEDDIEGILFVGDNPYSGGLIYDYIGELHPSTESEYNDYITKLNEDA